LIKKFFKAEVKDKQNIIWGEVVSVCVCLYGCACIMIRYSLETIVDGHSEKKIFKDEVEV